ncbi:hypothetical protein [Tsuneonella sp. HG222]
MNCDRRSILIGGVLATLPIPAIAVRNPRPVLTFFADAPMVDPGGSLPEWHSPPGHRGGAGIAALSPQDLRMAGLWL